jgi:outer membrane murein-binding lipoprotein Lpp
MKQVPILITAAAILWPLAPARCAPKAKAEPLSSQAEVTLREIDSLSSTVAEAAYNLDVLAQRGRDPLTHLDGLDTMKDDINRIGRDLKRLDAERDALAPWEVNALDQILPLMSDAAAKAQDAIEVYNSDRQRLWATSYSADTESVSNDARRVSSLLRDYRKLKQARENEMRIERDLGDTPQF